MRKVDDGEERKKKEKEKEKNGVFSGHYVIASSLPPERLRQTTTAGTPHARANLKHSFWAEWKLVPL